VLLFCLCYEATQLKDFFVSSGQAGRPVQQRICLADRSHITSCSRGADLDAVAVPWRTAQRSLAAAGCLKMPRL